jgi:hypothetical protein
MKEDSIVMGGATVWPAMDKAFEEFTDVESECKDECPASFNFC